MDAAAHAEFEAFRRRYQQASADPHEVVALFVEALLAIERDPLLGEQLVTVTADPRLTYPEPEALSGRRFRRADGTLSRLVKHPEIARSYAGGTPERGYADCDPAAPEVTFDTTYSAARQGVGYPRAGAAKLFLATTGAPKPRPITLAQDAEGRWRVVECSSVFAGVAAAPAG